MKTLEQMAEEYCNTKQLSYVERLVITKGFIDGYQAAKDQLADTSKVMNSPEKLDSCEHILDMEKMVDVNSSNNSNGWISVKDELPEYDQLVLLWHPDFKRQFVGCRVDSGIIDPLYWWQLELDMHEPEGIITHWMPLPEPPKEEKQCQREEKPLDK